MQHLKLFEELDNPTQELSQIQTGWLKACTVLNYWAQTIGSPDKTGRGKWSINPQTGLVDIKGDFNCRRSGIEDLMGVKFGEVTGHFICDENFAMKSLIGAPIKVGGNFNCSENQLTSLEGAPQEIGGFFNCSENQLTSLKGGPRIVKGGYSCILNELTSLEGAPQEIGRSFEVNDSLNNEYGGFIKIEWTPEGFAKGFKKRPDLFAPFITDAKIIKRLADKDLAQFLKISSLLDPTVLDRVLVKMEMNREELQSLKTAADFGFMD
jgi:hypothetical protein